MVRNLQRGAVLSTSSTDTGLHGGGTGTCISLIYYLADKKTVVTQKTKDEIMKQREH